MKTIQVSLIAIATIVAANLAAEDEFNVAAAWEKDCQKCHAEDGSGLTKKGRKLRLKDYRLPEVQAEMTDEEIIKALKNGVEKDGELTMNAYNEDYTEEQLQALLAYVRAMAK